MSSSNKHLDFKHKQTPDKIEQSVRAYCGPIPPPELLKQYENIFSGAAERIIAMAEKQSNHRQELEKNIYHLTLKILI